MLKFIARFLLLTLVTAAQTRLRYRVLDPFSSNGLWTEVPANPEGEHENSGVATTRVQPETNEEKPMMVERSVKVRTNKASKHSQQREKKVLDAKKEAQQRDDEKEMAEVVHHFGKDSAVPYLPDLTALKQITSAGVGLPSPIPFTAVTSSQREVPARIRASRANSNQAKAQSHSTKHRRRRKVPAHESLPLNVAPPMPQLPSLAAATNAPLPPEYPRWDPSRLASLVKASEHPLSMDTALLEMGSSSGTSHGASGTGDTFSPPSMRSQFAEDLRPSGGRAAWPSDVSPPADYFLPPEVLI